MQVIDNDITYMRMAINMAHQAARENEVPVGAVIVHKDRVIARAYNQVELLKDPTAHAEIIAITQAASALENWRLLDTVLYVTKEPCPMCAGAIVQARIPRVVWAMTDPLRGGGRSLFNILQCKALNHHVEICSGILEEDGKDLLQTFFQKKRITGPS